MIEQKAAETAAEMGWRNAKLFENILRGSSSMKPASVSLASKAQSVTPPCRSISWR